MERHSYPTMCRGVRIQLVRSALAIEHKAVAEECGDEFTSGDVAKIGVVDGHEVIRLLRPLGHSTLAPGRSAPLGLPRHLRQGSRSPSQQPPGYSSSPLPES